MNLDVTLVLYRSDRPMVARCLASLARQRVTPRVWILLSAATGDLERWLGDLVADLRLETRVISRPDNLGFAAGHNYLLLKAFEHGADFALVLNPDIELLDEACLARLEVSARQIEQDCDMPALHAPRLVRALPAHGGREVLDSEGIRWTTDRRHFDVGQGEPASIRLEPWRVAGVTGAALLVGHRTWRSLQEVPGYFFDPLFLAYREDAELGLRILQLGGSCWVHPIRGFTHVRGAANAERTSDIQKYLGVRNRFLIKYRLAALSREGMWFRGLLRDLIVIAAVILSERKSFPAYREARRLRRTMRFRGRSIRAGRSRARLRSLLKEVSAPRHRPEECASGVERPGPSESG